MLRGEQLQRYKRNILLSEIGCAGQERLLASKVLIIGVGGLGSPVAMYLGAAGVGTLGLVDDDLVDISNLQRQVLYTEESIGLFKAKEAAKRISSNNSDVKVQIHLEKFTELTASALLKAYDFIIDATDSIITKFLINDCCIAEKKPFCHGGVVDFIGQVMTVIPGKTACYRCLFKKPPEGKAAAKCSDGGVLGSVAATIGSIQATEAIKFITGREELLTDRLLIYEALNSDFRKIDFKRDLTCPVCRDLFLV